MGQYSDLFDDSKPKANPALALQLTADANPDEEANYLKLAKRYKVPVEVVRTLPDDYKAKAKVDDVLDATTNAPKLRSWLSVTDNARLAADDAGPLGDVEQAVAKYGELKAWKGPEPTTWNIITGLAKSVPQAGAAIKAGMQMEMGDALEALGILKRDPIYLADQQRKLQQAVGAGDFTRPNIESSTGAAVYSGVESFLRAIPGLAASVITRSPTPAMVAIGVQTQGEAYGKYRARGGTAGEAFLGAGGETLVELATEYLPGKYLAEALGKTGAKEFILNFLKKDALGEQAATIFQDAIDTAIANPDKTWDQYIAERPEAAYQTLVATLTQAGLMSGVNTVLRKVAETGDQGAEAEQRADALQNLMKAAESSALRERSPEQFRQVMTEMTDGKIYVDGQVLNQLPEDVKASLPQAVRDQIEQAAATGDTVEIPMADVLTLAPGTPLEQVLNEHARMDPFAQSMADVKMASEQAQELLKQEAERVIQQASDQEAMRASSDAVKASIQSELGAAGRFRPAVNEGLATWATAFYTTMAARTGMTPEQFYAKHRLRILGAPSAGGQQVMDQGQAFDLIVTHNLTAENLLHAAKLGGLAVPSLAVTKRDTPLGGFGGITLIGPPEMADPKGYAETKVFGADIYSPRYPNVERELNTKAVGTLQKRIAAMADRLGVSGLFDSTDLQREGQRTLERSLPLMAAFLVGKGIEPNTVMRAGMDEGRRARLEQFGLGPFMGETSAFELQDNPEFVAAAVAEARDAYATLGKRDALVKAIDNDARFRDSIVRDLARTITADAKLRAKPEADAYATEQAMQKQIADGDLAAEYQRFVQSELQGITKSERIFQGFTYSGNRKYIAHTLENVVKILKKELRGGESFNYGVGSLRAKFTLQFKSVAAIRKAKDRLVSAEQFEAVKKEIDAEFFAVGEAISPDLSNDTLMAILEDSARMGVKPAAKSYGYEVSDAAAVRVAEFLTRLRELPTAYFEAKILRDVSLSEFKAAVVPDDTPAEALDALRAAGVTDIRTYAKGGEADRAAKIGEAVDAGGLLFQGTQTPRGTFNPKTLELVLNPNANLSTFFHETGHFFLEVMADIASQPDAPAQIVEDFNTFLKWADVKDAATWNALDLDGKRKYHERWAESIEQYVMEGKAPSVELQPLMRRFATWLKSVYGSIKQFLASRGQAAAGGEALNQMPAPEGVLTDDSGKPLVLYHGTAQELVGGKFNPDLAKSEGGAFYFSNSSLMKNKATNANDYAKNRSGSAPQVIPAYLKMTNPLVVGFSEPMPEGDAAIEAWLGRMQAFNRGLDRNKERYYKDAIKEAKRNGHDGVIIKNVEDVANDAGRRFVDETDVYIVFDPKQIVSAISGEVLGQDPAAQPGPPMALNDDIRRVMDRMLATDEQIAQANEVAGLVPDVDADAQAAERLAKRSIADLKWSVKARDQVIAKLQKQAKAIEKDLREQVTVEVDQTPEMRAKRALDALTVSPEYAGILAEHKAARKAAEATVRDEVKAALLAENPDVKGLVKGQLLMKNKRDIDNKVDAAMIKWDAANPVPARPVNATDEDVATIADSFGFESVDAMMQAIDAFGSRREAIDGMTEQRMLEEHGDLIDERAISEAANEAVHNEARARSLATELRTQREMLGARTDTGETNAKGSKITVNALVEAAKQFAANVVSKTTLRDLTARAWQHTAAERRAAKRWQEATAAGKTEEAVKAKQDQMLNHAAAKAAIDAKAEAKKILDFFKRVTQGNDETVVEKGRDADIVNAARAVLGAYGVQTSTTKRADEYLEAVAKNDPETYNVIFPMIEGATRNGQPLDALTFEELQALEEEIQALWFLAKRSRQMEVGGDLLDVEDVAAEVYDRLEEIGIPDTIPGETGALTDREIQARRWLQQVPALLRRVEQWAEAKDGKFGGPFLRYIFQPVKDAADRYRTAKIEYRKKFGDLVDAIAPMMPAGLIQAPELGYVFGRGHNGIGMSELLHAIAHTGNESNKRKLLLGRGWATDNGDGTIDTSRWDAFIQRMTDTGVLQREHFDFVQGIWDLMEQTKPLAQKTHREVFGRYFAEVTADPFVDPFGVQRAGGYIPAQADPLLVQDADLRELLETDNAGMSQAFPATNKGFTRSRVEYNRPLKLDLRTLPQHIDKVLLFSHMEPAVRGVARLLRQPKVAQPLARVDPAAIGGMLKPWLNRSARQTVETPVSADAGLNRVLSTIRSRVGMALMFANVSNTLQQITGFSSAALKVKPGLMTRAAAQFIASPTQFKEAVWALSPYMADRASNEVAVMSDTMEKILIKPSVYARAEMWTREHAYFLQTAFDNVMSPIIWTGAYNQAVAEGMDERMAIRYADGVIRQTQGSTLPEDISRIESGPAYARVFTQFIGYFNMLANTNATALQQIAGEQGLKKGAGKAFGVVMLGLLVPIWVAEAIAHAMRGGPDDEDDDGYLDDWLAAVFGFGTIRGILGGLPFVGAAAQSAVNRFNDQPADDKFSLSPTVSVLESAVAAPASVYGAIVEDKNAQKAVRDLSALITVATGLPAMTLARPVGYAAGVVQGRIEPTGPVDAARGLVTGTASPDSKQR